jgi:hypothetical protein
MIVNEMKFSKNNCVISNFKYIVMMINPIKLCGAQNTL